MPIAAALPVREQERAQPRQWTRASGIRAGLAQRRIVLLAADGLPNAEIAARVGVSRPTVNLWRNRCVGGAGRIAGPPAAGSAAAGR